MNTNKIYDIVGIGIGPFNLGLAALAEDLPLECLFIDKNTEFNWHPGLMLPTAKMQVPFYADLVTLADPTSPYSYMNYLKCTGRLFRFAINESYFPYRTEYNDYCKWVVNQLGNLYFGYECISVSYNKKERIYMLTVQEVLTNNTRTITARHIVIGIGSTAHVPDFIIDHPNIFHASEYLWNKAHALKHKRISIIGSGQSAAEIFMDLLTYTNQFESLHWYTRSPRFYAMDYSKLSLELSSPAYIDHFYSLPVYKKSSILAQQHDLHKGINFSLIDAIYQQLYLLSLDNNNNLPRLFSNCELRNIDYDTTNDFNLDFCHLEKENPFSHSSEIIILATGYHSKPAKFLCNIGDHINWTSEGEYAVNKNYSIDHNNSIFIQNAEHHNHGFNAADLGLGPYRNAVILNSISGKQYFDIESESTFQSF